MPAYADPADLNSTLSVKALQGFSDAQKVKEIAAASSEADGYLASRVALPLTAWGEDLRRHVCSIAGYRLILGRGFNPAEGANEALRLAYEDAMRWLRDVSHGTVNLPKPPYADSGVAASSSIGPGRPKVVAMKVDAAGLPVVGRPKPRGW